VNIFFTAFIFFAPAYPMPTLSALGFLSPGLVAFLAILMVFVLLTFQASLYWNKFASRILLVLLVLLFSDLLCVFVFQDPQQLLYVGGRLSTILIFLVGLSFKPDRAKLKTMLAVYCWSITILSLLTIIEGTGLATVGGNVHVSRTFFGINMPFLKATGLNMSDGEFGIMVVPAFLFCLLQFIPGSDANRIRGAGFMLPLMAMAILISQSRSTWLGITLAFLVLIIMLPKGKHGFPIILLMGLGSLLFVLSNIQVMIFEGLAGEGIFRANIFNRLFSYSLAFEYLSGAPLFGVGHGNATHIVFGKEMVIHNQILDQLASAGLIGGIPLIALYVIFFWTALRLYRETPLGAGRHYIIWLTASMVHVMTELMLYRGFYSEHLPWFFALLALLYSFRHGYKRVVMTAPVPRKKAIVRNENLPH